MNVDGLTYASRRSAALKCFRLEKGEAIKWKNNQGPINVALLLFGDNRDEFGFDPKTVIKNCKEMRTQMRLMHEMIEFAKATNKQSFSLKKHLQKVKDAKWKTPIV